MTEKKSHTNYKSKLKANLFKDAFCSTNKSVTAIKNAGSIILAIFTALIVSVLIATASGYNPGELISDLFTKAFIDWKALIVNISVLGIGSLAFIFAFKVGLFNIGISGQMLAAGMACLAVALGMKNVNFPPVLAQIFMMSIAILTAMAVGGLISVLKIYLKVNEVVSSILLNWIIFFIVRYIIVEIMLKDATQQITASPDFPVQFTLNQNGYGWLAAIIILAILSVITFVLLKYTVFGTKMIGVGKSLNSAKYIGYNTKAYLISSFCISSAIAGILGYVLYTAGEVMNIPISPSVDAVPVEGMNGIAIGLISMSHPLVVLPVSFIIGLFQSSAQYLVGGAAAISNLIIGFVILGAAMVVVFLKFKPWIWFKKWAVCRTYEQNYKKYINQMDSNISKYKAAMYDATKYYALVNKDAEKMRKILNNDQDLINKFSQFTKEQMFEQIYNDYINERREIKAQFKKHNLIDKASQVFWYKLENKRQREEINYEIDIQKIKSSKRLNEKVLAYQNQTDLLAKIEKVNTKIELLEFQTKKQILAAQEKNHSTSKYETKLANEKQKLLAEIQKIEQQMAERKSQDLAKANEVKVRIANNDKEYEALRARLLKKLDNNLVNHKGCSKSKVEHTYRWAMRDAKKLQLVENEKQLVIKWVQESYEQAIKEFGVQPVSLEDKQILKEEIVESIVSIEGSSLETQPIQSVQEIEHQSISEPQPKVETKQVESKPSQPVGKPTNESSEILLESDKWKAINQLWDKYNETQDPKILKTIKFLQNEFQLELEKSEKELHDKEAY